MKSKNIFWAICLTGSSLFSNTEDSAILNIQDPVILKNPVLKNPVEKKKDAIPPEIILQQNSPNIIIAPNIIPPDAISQEESPPSASIAKKSTQPLKIKKQYPRYTYYLCPPLRIFTPKGWQHIPIMSLEGRIGMGFLQSSFKNLQDELAQQDKFDLKTKSWSTVQGGGSLKMSFHQFFAGGLGFGYLRSPRFSESILQNSDTRTQQKELKRGLIWHDFLLFLEIESSAMHTEIKEDDAIIRANAEKRRIKMERKKRKEEDPAYAEKLKLLEKEEALDQEKEKKLQYLNKFNLSWIFRGGINFHWRELQGIDTAAKKFTHKSEFFGPGILMEPAIRFSFRLQEQSYVFIEYANTMLIRTSIQNFPVPAFRNTHKISLGFNFMNPVRFQKNHTTSSIKISKKSSFEKSSLKEKETVQSAKFS